MENRNIYKMDDFLLAVSVLLLIPTAYFAWPWLRGITSTDNLQQYFLDAPVVLGSQFLSVSVYLLGAVACQAGGRYVRFQEKISLQILDEIGYSRKTRLADVAVKLGLSEKRTSALVGKLARIPSLKLTVEGDRISRTRESIKFNRNSESASLYDKPQGPKSTDTAGTAFKSIPEEKENPPLQVSALFRQSDDGKKTGTLPLILLMILFLTPLWPIALIYIIRKAIKNPPAENSETHQ